MLEGVVLAVASRRRRMGHPAPRARTARRRHSSFVGGRRPGPAGPLSLHLASRAHPARLTVSTDMGALGGGRPAFTGHHGCVGPLHTLCVVVGCRSCRRSLRARDHRRLDDGTTPGVLVPPKRPDLDELWRFVLVDSNDRCLVIAWMLTATQPEAGRSPGVLYLTGPQNRRSRALRPPGLLWEGSPNASSGRRRGGAAGRWILESRPWVCYNMFTPWVKVGRR